MKQIIITILVCFIGMTVFAQSVDLSYFTEEYNRSIATFIDRLEILETVRNANLSGVGEFYHDALKVLLTKIPDIKTKEEWDAVEASSRLLCQELGNEQYTEAAPELWRLVQYYDIVNYVNDGLAMQDALVAIGKVGDKDYVQHVVLALDDFNTLHSPNVETRRRIQRAAVGAISALEDLHDIDGYRPVFFAYVGWYDPAIRAMASAALPNIVEDPGEVISAIIRDSYNEPSIKLTAWQEMLRTRAPDSSKAKVAATALAAGWSYPTNDPHNQRVLREMRISAINTITQLGVEDDSVYGNLEKSYANNYLSNSPDYEEIRRTIDCLSASKSDESVDILLKFLRDLNERRRVGPWGNKERLALQLVIPGIGGSQTQSPMVRMLLTTIMRSNDYTGAEQGWARDALRQLGM